MKKSIIAVAVILSAMFAGMSAWAEDAPFKLKPDQTMRDVIAEHSGKVLALRLVSGEEIEGTVALVGNGLVQISRLTGREFFDSVVSIDKVIAVRMRTKTR